MKKNELTTIYLDMVAIKEKERWSNFEESFQREIKSLSQTLNVKFETTEQIAEISPEWLTRQIEQSRENLKGVLGAGSFVPVSISKQFDDNYASIKRSCTPLTDGIMYDCIHLAESGVGFYLDENGVPHLNQNDLQEKIDAAATRTFNDTQKEGLGYISAITKALNKLRAWEKANKLLPSRIVNILSASNHANSLKGEDVFDVSPVELYNRMQMGDIFQHYTSDDAQEAASGEET